MKRFFLLGSFAALSLPLLAHTTPLAEDTVIISSPHRVIVTTSDSTQTIKVEGSGTDSNFRYTHTLRTLGNSYAQTQLTPSLDFSLPIGRKGCRAHSNFVLSMNLNLGLGMIAPTAAPKGLKTHVGVSHEIILKDLFEMRYHKEHARHSFSLGWGMTWQNFRMTDRTRFSRTTDGTVVYHPYAADVSPLYSRLKVFSHNVGFTHSYRFSKFFSLHTTAQLSFNTYGSLLTRYHKDGRKQKELDKDLHLAPVTGELMVRARLRYFSLYTKYSPFSPISRSFGPRMSNLSFGIFLF